MYTVLKITLNNGNPIGCNNLDMMKDNKKQVFSFPNNNDKHLETSIFAVTLRESTTVKQQDNYHTKKIKHAQ